MSLFLVTGGCGFIGTHLCRMLAASGHRLRVLDDLSSGCPDGLPAGTELIIGNVADPETAARTTAGTDGCFHLAAVASVQRCNEDWLASHRINLGGTVAIFEAALAAGRIPVVYASSAAVYGAGRDLPLAETAPTRPLSAYAADKLGSELHAAAAGLVHGLPTFGLRFFNVYGPGQNPDSPYSGVISIFARRLAEGRPLLIHGDGLQARDFVHVSDVAAALIAAMGAAGVDAPLANVCTGRMTTLLELAQLLGRAAGQAPRIEYGAPRPGDIRLSCGDPGRARELLGFSARIGMAEGLVPFAGREPPL